MRMLRTTVWTLRPTVWTLRGVVWSLRRGERPSGLRGRARRHHRQGRLAHLTRGRYEACVRVSNRSDQHTKGFRVLGIQGPSNRPPAACVRFSWRLFESIGFALRPSQVHHSERHHR
eukprot:1609548-Pyramimonas_sp.AAC.1